MPIAQTSTLSVSGPRRPVVVFEPRRVSPDQLVVIFDGT